MELLTTKEVAKLLRTKERKVYELVSQNAIPVSRVTGKLLFPRALVEAWIRRHMEAEEDIEGLDPRAVVLVGSQDPLLDWSLRESGCGIASFCDGSLDGLERLVAGKGIAAKAPDVLFLACATAANPRRAADAARAAAVARGKVALPDAGVRCCGAPLRDLGFTKAFEALARENQAALAGHRRILCDAAICARTLEKAYPEAGADLGAPVVDLVTALNEALDDGRLAGIERRPEKAVYHDPCHLGRRAGVYDAPRRLAAALFEKPLGEFSWSRERGNCCGGGGGFPFVDRGSARMMAGAIAAEAREAGYDLIVTGSAECAAMLSEARPAFPVRTIACLLAEALSP